MFRVGVLERCNVYRDLRVLERMSGFLMMLLTL